jgi:shikimate kinase
MKKKIVYLTGFMASGKSTYGKILANVLGWENYDLDKMIVEREGMEVVDIFSQKGEEYFRKLETEILRETSNYENAVVSLGGGTVINTENLEICKSTGIVIYLKCSVGTITQRIIRKTTRPIFRDLVVRGKRREISDKVKTMLAAREKYYLKAHIVVNTDMHGLGRTIDFIVKKLKRMI